MIDKILNLYKRYKEIINYLFFGGLSTIVNFGSYYVCAKIINIDEVVSSGISWFLAVLFAYVTNKLFVFESRTNKKSEILKEITSFLACRIISGILCDVGTFALMVKVLNINDLVSKIVTQIMVIIANYLFLKRNISK